MPKIRFFLISCPRCNAEYKVRLERVEDRKPFECLACGEIVILQEMGDLLKIVHDYSKAVIDLETHGKVEADTFILPKKVQVLPSIY